MNIKLFKDFSIIKKIIIVFVVSVLIPVIIIVQVIIKKSTDKIIEQTVSLSDNFVSNISNNISEIFNEKLDVIKKVCFYDQTIKSILSMRNNYNAVDNLENYISFIEKYEFDLVKNNVDLRIYYLQDTIIQNYSTFIYADDNIKNKQEYLLPLDSSKALVWGYIGEEKKVFVSGKVRDSEGENAGIAAVYIDYSDIYDIINIDEVSKWEEAIILDENGNVIISTSQFSTVDSDFLKEIAMNQKYEGILDYKNKYKIIFKDLNTNTNFMNWKLVTVISIKDITSDANKVKNDFLLISVAVMSLSFILFFINIKIIANRIKYLTLQMKQVASGRFEKIKYDYSNNELGVMTKSFNKMVINLDDLINENNEKNIRIKEIEVKKREAELYALQSQIQPHFLFNTLESIRMKLVSGNLDESDEMILNLAKCLRKTLSWHSEMIKIEEELELVISYLDVQKLRFKGKFDYSIDCSNSELYGIKIPKLIIQPLVENSVMHGVEVSMNFVNIEISIWENNNDVFIKISDNGVGISEKKLLDIIDKLSTENLIENAEHIGLRNINDRLVLYYGKEYSLLINSEIDKGTEIIIRIPKDDSLEEQKNV